MQIRKGGAAILSTLNKNVSKAILRGKEIIDSFVLLNFHNKS